MAVVKLNIKELKQLLGFDISTEEIVEKLPMLGCDIEGVEGEYLYVEFFPNRPDLYSVEGVARALRSFLGFEPGLKEYKLLPPRTYLEVDPSVSSIRPYVVACEVEKVRLNDEHIQLLMELQEDLHWVLGRDRKKVSIGVHSAEKIQPPFRYTALRDDEIAFVPLGMSREMSPEEILREHPKGIAYAHIIEGHGRYPFILDSRRNVLSMPPIINGELTRVTTSTTRLFVDITGTDLELISKALNILTTAFIERGFEVYQVEVRYPDRTLTTPDYTPEEMKVNLEYVNRLLGFNLTPQQAKEALERMGYSATVEDSQIAVKIPAYRADIFHPVDIVEDVAIGYGYEKIEAELPGIPSIGREHPLERVTSKLRKLLLGYGFTEIISLMLTNPRDCFENLLREGEAVTIKNPKSEEHTLVRDTLLPSLLSALRLNRHHELPQKIFEIGDVLLLQNDSRALEDRRLGIAIISSKAGFSEIKSIAEALMRDLSLKGEIKPVEKSFYINGRAAGIYIGNQEVAHFGELKPEVITAFELEYPVVVLEMSLKPLLS